MSITSKEPITRKEPSKEYRIRVRPTQYLHPGQACAKPHQINQIIAVLQCAPRRLTRVVVRC